MESRYAAEGAARMVHDLAPRASEPLALRTYSARLIGADPALVLHGGGNTSVKATGTTALGETIEVLHIKGSGWDLATIEPEGHPAVRLEPLRRLRALEAMTDEAMVNELRTNLLEASAPTPSVETLLHAFLPARFVDHTHADAILALANLVGRCSRNGKTKEFAHNARSVSSAPRVLAHRSRLRLPARSCDGGPSSLAGLLTRSRLTPDGRAGGFRGRHEWLDELPVISPRQIAIRHYAERNAAEDAYALLVRLGAPARLVRHGELVAEAGDLLLAVMRSLEVEVDESLVRAGCLLHDVGKVLHPDELHGGGAEHEAAGERLLLAHDVDASIARCCRSHAQWRSMSDASLEELLVALADVTWKGRRSPELEERVVDEVTRRAGRDRWEAFVAIDDAAETVADGGAERLARG